MIMWLPVIPIFFWSFSDVFSRFAITEWNVNATVFVCIYSFVASIILIAISKPESKENKSALRVPHTWLFSLSNIVFNILFMLCLAYMSTTTASLLLRLSIVTALVSVSFLGRKSGRYEILGSLFVIAGCLPLVLRLEENTRFLALVLMLAAALVRTLQTIITETHPSMNNKLGIRQRCRITGVVLGVTSICFLLFTLFLSPFAKDFTFLPVMPDFANIIDLRTFLSAVLVGVFIMAPAYYFYFLATKKAGSEIYLAINSIAPVICYVIEKIAVNMGYMHMASMQRQDFIAAFLIVFGAFLVVFAKIKEQRRRLLV